MKRDSDIIRTVADQCLLPPKTVKEILSRIRDVVYSDLIDTGKSRIPLMGIVAHTRVRKATEARMGRNPLTGEEIMFKAKPPARMLRCRISNKTKQSILDEIDRLYGPPKEEEEKAS